MSSYSGDSPLVPGGFGGTGSGGSYMDAGPSSLASPNPGSRSYQSRLPTSSKAFPSNPHGHFEGSGGASSSRSTSPTTMHSRKGSVASIQSGGPTQAEEDRLAKSPTTRRAAMDRIKSRAVDSGWNWEAERERGEESAQQRSDRGQHGDGQGQQQGASSFAVPPRYSSRTSAGPGRSRNDSYQGPQHPNAPSGSSPRNSLTQNRASDGGNIPPSHSHSAHRERHMTPSGSSSGKREQLCDACGKPMTGQFVRALGVVFHLDCFRCRDCNKVVASKFFPATEDMKDVPSPRTAGEEEQRSRSSDVKGVPQKLFPLCETDYFRRLDLLCATCGGALRGSYITALGKKFHVEHFTCSVCTTVFGPQDSYYEHDGRVFCHFHYSTRFAIQCSGCRTAILKQFVEINRNNQDEHWHPECYMIHKFWNIKLCPTGATPKGSVAAEPTVSDAPAPSNSGVAPTTGASASDLPGPEALEIEASETPSSLRKKQKTMEEQVFRIWTVLSAFEESSAACISEMLRHVSSGRYLGGVRMAERFILHVEILFSAIDDIERAFRRERTKGLSHIREARMLCKKIVNFFSLLSHTQETGAQRMGITQELLSLVTGLAHYLKILIRIALTGALKLDRDHDNRTALVRFLDQLAYLAERAALSAEEKGTHDERGDFPSNELSMQGPDGKWYGYRSLPRSTSIASTDGNEGATDLCVSCGQTVEEECVRMGINMRWHTSCLRCCHCKRKAHKESSGPGAQTASRKAESDSAPEDLPSLPPSAFALEVTTRPPPAEGSQRNGGSSSRKLFLTYCSEHSPANARRGFETGTRLEQYAFLLRVALNRLYALLKKRGVVPASPPAIAPTEISTSDSTTTIKGADRDSTYGDSTEVRRMKSVNLDRKLSTKAKVPRISTVIGSPSGRQPTASSLQRISPSTDGGSTDSRLPSPKDASIQNTLETTRSRSPTKKPFRRSPSPVRASTAGSSPVPEPGSVIPIRPAFARHNTDVRIREDGPMRQPSGDDGKDPLGAHDEGLTLADIPQLLEAEQAREQRRSLQHDGRSLGELSALELFIVKHMAVMMLQQSALKDMVPMDDLIEFIETRKNTFWGKLFKGGKDKKKVEKKGTFGIALDILVERSGADSTLGASGAQLRIPCFIDDIISAMKQMDVSVEGIFRKNGNIRRLKELSEALDRDSSSVNLADDNPVQLAALLKKFLRELPDPLLTFKLHRLFVMSQKIEPESERLRVLQLVTILLPKAHRDTLEVLFVFLRWVASFSHVDEETGSKMDLQNLAMVLGPNILYAKSGDPAKDELFLANRAILCLLEHLDDFWQIPPELDVVLQDRDLLNASADLTSRDILKKCEKYARRAGPNRGGGNGGSGSGDSGKGNASLQGGGGQGHRGPYLDVSSRNQRPEYHDANSSRQTLEVSSSNGRINSAYPRSPIDEDGPGRAPWAESRSRSSREGSGSSHQQHQQQHQQSSYYGSPEREQHGSWGSGASHHPNGGQRQYGSSASNLREQEHHMMNSSASSSSYGTSPRRWQGAAGGGYSTGSGGGGSQGGHSGQYHGGGGYYSGQEEEYATAPPTMIGSTAPGGTAGGGSGAGGNAPPGGPTVGWHQYQQRQQQA